MIQASKVQPQEEAAGDSEAPVDSDDRLADRRFNLLTGEAERQPRRRGAAVGLVAIKG